MKKEIIGMLATLPTPFYYYDTELLQKTLDEVKQATSAYPDYHVHYAVKANANPKILDYIRLSGIGIDCVSGGEIQAALNAGFSPDKIVYAGVGKSDWEILLGLRNNIFCFNVESIPELEVINQLAKQEGKIANVCFRINPNVGAHTHANITTGLAENKFGIAMDDMVNIINIAESLPNINYMGLHFHIGSQITEMDDFKALCFRVNELQDILESNSIHTKIINVGGGLGIDYNDPSKNPIPDFKTYFNTYSAYLKLRPHQSLHFELGRSIVGQCGSLITKVLYVKKTSQKQFAIVDAGMTELIRPALYQAKHKIENLTPSTDTVEKYDVVGPICESSDVFDKDIPLPSIERGNILAIHSAGAYGEIMASCYNCRPLPKSYTESDIN
jgi:diaminopimelate decarboxylase